MGVCNYVSSVRHWRTCEKVAESAVKRYFLWDIPGSSCLGIGTNIGELSSIFSPLQQETSETESRPGKKDVCKRHTHQRRHQDGAVEGSGRSLR